MAWQPGDRVCPQCRRRRVFVQPNGKQRARCRPCFAANTALEYYWREIGQPLSTRGRVQRLYAITVRSAA